MHYNRSSALLLLGAVTLSGCSVASPPLETLPKVGPASMTGTETSDAREPGLRAAINAGEKQLASIAETRTPSLKDLKEIEPVGGEFETSEEEGDKLRRPAMRDTATAFGARGGLAHTSRQINKMLQKRASRLDSIYDFDSAIIRGPDNVIVLPPVISRAEDSYELSEGGKTVRIADEIYEIIEQARLAPVAPLWHSYLIRDYSSPNDPPGEILPKTPEEREFWAHHVEQGWEAGVEQANDIFQADLNRLDRDYEGMVRYKVLLAEGKVSEPIVSKAPMGVTGGGNDMRVNDNMIRIMRDPSLQTDTSKWTPTISNGPPSEYARPEGSTTVRDYPMDADRKY